MDPEAANRHRAESLVPRRTLQGALLSVTVSSAVELSRQHFFGVIRVKTL